MQTADAGRVFFFFSELPVDVLVPLLVEVVFVVAVVVVMVVVVREVVIVVLCEAGVATRTSHVLRLSGPILKRAGLMGQDEEDDGGDEEKHAESDHLEWGEEDCRARRTRTVRTHITVDNFNANHAPRETSETYTTGPAARRGAM